jgi:hypothetical protein
VGHKQAGGGGVQAGRNNTGTQIGGSVIGDSALEKLLKSSNPPPSQPPPVPVKAPLPQLRLSFSSCAVEIFDETIAFAQLNPYAQIDSHGAHFIIVHNKEAEQGGTAPRADAISAQIKFKSAGSSAETFVARSCWIGRVENEIYLHPGDSEHVLLGIPTKTEWLTYLNPNKRDAGGWPAHNLPLRPITFSTFPSAVIRGVVKIISNRTNNSTTLIERAFVITVSETSFFINIRWEDEA